MSIHATSTEVYTGKNLFDKNNPNLFSGYFDGDISSPTIVSGVTERNRIVFIPCKPSTTYSLSAQNLQGIAQIQVGTTSTMPAAGVSVYSLGYFGNNKTTPNDAKYLLARVQSNVGVDIADILQDFLSGLQIEIGSTATSYEPYISHFGKNMFDWNYIANSGATFGTNNSNGTIEVDTYGIHYKNPTGADQYFTVNGYGAVEPNAASVMRMYNLSPNTRYTISYTATNYSQVFIRFFNLSGGIVQTLSNSVTAAGRVSFSFTTPASTYGYQIRIDNEAYGHGLPSLNNDISNIQIETGSTATSYEPYVESLPSPLIRDVLHVSTSKNLLNMQSTSNGEYLGTTNQQTYSGKNILNASSPFTVTNSTVYRSIPISIPNGTTVCVQCDSITTNSTTGCSVRFQDSNLAGVGTVILYPGTTLSQSVTLIGDAAYCFVYSSNNYASSQSATTTYTNLMVSKGSTAQSYEPYVGGIPSPSPNYPQEIVTGKLKSKNLFALGKTNGTIADVLYTYNSDGTFSLSGTASAGTGAKSGPIPISESGLIPGEKYSFWCDHNIGWGSNSCVYYAQSCDSGGNWTGNLMTFTQNGGTATMPETTTQYVMFVAAIGNGSSYSNYNNVKAQLVAGEQVDNVFEPYFTPIELAQKDSYQDRVYKYNSGWVLHKEMGKTDLATETWTQGGVGAGGAIYMVSSSISNIKYVPNNQTLGSGFAEKYIMRIGSGLSGNSAINQIAIDVTRVGVNVGFTEVTPSGLFYYALATPTDTAITDSATIAWLNKYDTDSLPHHKYVNTRRTTYVGASGLSSAIDLYDGSYASTLPTYSTANDHHLTTANGGTYTVSLQNISASIVSGTVTFSVFTNQRKIDFSWNGSATSTNVSVSLQADEYIKSIYAYIPQNADAGITLSQQLESGSLTDFEPYYNIVKIYAGDDLVFEDTSLTD